MATLAQTFAPVRHRKNAWLLIPAAAALLAALIQSFLIPLDCDVSWLITVSEKLLAGQRLYVDVIEPNPPASVWLYMPEVSLAQRLGFRPEAIVASAFIGAALLSCWATAQIGARLRQPPNRPALLASLCFVSLILPLGTFAQREHAALFLSLPAFAGLAVLADGKTLSRGTRLMLGICAGLVMVIKPHFALAIIAPTFFAWIRSKRAAPLVLPAAAAGLTVALYGAALAYFTPHYLDLVPMLAAVYLPLQERWPILLLGPVVAVPAAIYGLVWGLRSPRLPTLAWMLLLGSIGFAAAAVIQMKGYLNHALPAMALGFVAIVIGATSSGIERGRAKAVLILTALLAAFELYAMASIQPPVGLAQGVERIGPQRPKMMTLGPDLLTGHPVVRNVGGEWVGSRPALFIAAGARRAMAEGSSVSSARLQGWYEGDLAAFASDVARRRPDVVLVDARPDAAWLRNESAIQGAMTGYKRAGQAEDVEIWIRR